MKKILLLAAAPLLALSLAACDNKKEEGTEATTPAATTETQPATPPAPPVTVTPETAPQSEVPTGNVTEGEGGTPVLQNTDQQAPADLPPPAAPEGTDVAPTATEGAMAPTTDGNAMAPAESPAQPNADTPVKEKN